MKKVLSIDIETYSSENLKKVGVGKYADSQSFEILLIAYAFNDGEVKIIDLAQKEEISEEFTNALFDEKVIKSAYNAFFEIACLSKHFKEEIPIKNWQCTMVWGAYAGLPMGLGKVGHILGLAQQKDTTGKNLIKYFSVPCKPTKLNGGRTRNYHYHDLDKWELYKNYCIQDVEVERDLIGYLISNRFLMPRKEWDLWEIDIKMLLRGVKVDTDFIEKIIVIDKEDRAKNIEILKEITGLENPNSITQLKSWIEEQTGQEINSLDKANVKNLIKITDNEEVKKALNIRPLLGKTSVKKYNAMESCVCEDSTVKGLLQFYGANRTGRWAGRLVQVQNLPQNHLVNIGLVRSDFKQFDYEQLSIIWGCENIQQMMSELIRTAFIPTGNKKFIVSDFSAIEARVVAYLGGESWRINVFNSHGKIYEASASKMFNVPIESITKASELRQKGKIAELALGYGGGVGALTSMGALEMGLKEEDLQPLVDAWRNSNENIVKFWKSCERASMKAVKEIRQVELLIPRTSSYLLFYIKGDNLCIDLPSERTLYYREPRLEDNKWGYKCLTYMNMNQTTKKWERTDTFGGKIVENIVQAVARDCLAESIKRLTDKGFKIVFHVHDEVVIECLENEASSLEIAKIMGEEIDWAKGLPLFAEAYECEFYMKD